MSGTAADAHLGPFVVVIPVIGGLIIGFMARFGSDRIRGHGIPEAIEAILMNGSRVAPNETRRLLGRKGRRSEAVQPV